MRQLFLRKKTIRYYVAANGKSPFMEWLASVDFTMQSRIERRLERMKLGSYGDYKVIGKGLCELRLDFGPGYRIYFTEQGGEIVMLLCGGDKSTQNRDIAAAKAYLEDLRGG